MRGWGGWVFNSKGQSLGKMGGATSDPGLNVGAKTEWREHTVSTAAFMQSSKEGLVSGGSAIYMDDMCVEGGTLLHCPIY